MYFTVDKRMKRKKNIKRKAEIACFQRKNQNVLLQKTNHTQFLFFILMTVSFLKQKNDIFCNSIM